MEKKLETREQADPQGLKGNVDGFGPYLTSCRKPFRGFKHGTSVNVFGFRKDHLASR